MRHVQYQLERVFCSGDCGGECGIFSIRRKEYPPLPVSPESPELARTPEKSNVLVLWILDLDIFYTLENFNK
jgi:hypothetical protein